ncbi:MAG: urease accessory UreF family protein [Thermoleophilia bacterium]
MRDGAGGAPRRARARRRRAPDRALRALERARGAARRATPTSTRTASSRSSGRRWPCGTGTLDAVALAHAWRADSVDGPSLPSTRGPPDGSASRPGARRRARAARRRPGRVPGRERPRALLLRRDRTGESDGNLPVVEGALAGSRGVPAEAAALVALRGTASALLAVAVRLGRLSARRAQAALRRLESTIAEAAARAASTDLADATSSAVELELAALLHVRADGRLFIT